MSNRFDDAVADYYHDHQEEIAEDYLEKFPDVLAAWVIKSASRELWDKLTAEFLADYKAKEFDQFSGWASDYVAEMLREETGE